MIRTLPIVNGGWKPVIFLLLIIGIVLRLFSLHWNTIPHGDVEADSRATASFRQYGLFLTVPVDMSHGLPPDVVRNPEGYFLTLHPPLWMMLGAGVLAVSGAAPTVQNAFHALQLLTFLCGLLVIALTYAVSRLFTDRDTSLLAAACIMLSSLMIDYSANGSFYILQAALYLLWVLVAMRFRGLRRASLLGVIIAVAYLVNYQTVILLPLSAVVLFMERTSWRIFILELALLMVIFAAIGLFWWIRNVELFGDPFFPHKIGNSYLFRKAGIVLKTINGKTSYAIGIRGWITVFTTMATSWIPNNLYYIARKLFILAPITFFFFAYAWIEYAFSLRSYRRMMPVILITIAHIAVSAAWPVTKFRYFVPMLPLVCILGLHYAATFPFWQRWRTTMAVSVVASLAVLSFLTFRAIPTHTSYYDGALTTDPFGGSEEMQFIQNPSAPGS